MGAGGTLRGKWGQREKGMAGQRFCTRRGQQGGQSSPQSQKLMAWKGPNTAAISASTIWGSAERGSKCAVEMRDRLEATVLYKGLGEASGDPRIIEFQSLLQKAPGAKAARPG